MSSKIRVVIADDSAVARSLLRAMLEEDGGFEVVAEARNGKEAAEFARELRPNLVTMDLMMPVMGGLDAITAIMSHRAIPILVVSAAADAKSAYAAVARGAVEVVAKPSPFHPDAGDFVARARLVAKVAVITHLRSLNLAAQTPATTMAGLSPPAPPPPQGDFEYGPVFAVAASTGGPQALTQILSSLPEFFTAPVLIAQHIVDGFAAGMAEWLSTLSSLPVRLAAEGDPVQRGMIYLAPSETNLAVTPGRRLTLVKRRPADIYRPSCDALLTSVAEVYGRRAVGLILSGMGTDGAKGIERIAAAGGDTLAQDEKSSVVFGMNRAAIATGRVRQVLPLDRIAAVMVERTMTGP